MSDSKISDHIAIIEKYRADLSIYDGFYRHVHQDPELSGVEQRTTLLVTRHLVCLRGFKVYRGFVKGRGVAGMLDNGPGKTILIRAELDALPTLEQTGLPYASKKRMIDRYGKERPVMHACGHDMNMAALLAATATLSASREHWSGTLIVVFQPDEEECGGAKAMVDGGLYSKVPIPDIMLAQHVVPLQSGKIAIKAGSILMAADAINIKIFGGPSPGVNPQFCQDPIQMAALIVHKVPKVIEKKLRPGEVATIACWSIHAGVPGADFVYEADVLLDVKTWEPAVRTKVLQIATDLIKRGCQGLNAPILPIIKHSVRAPLTNNSPAVVDPVKEAFGQYFGSDLVEMQTTPATEDFAALQGDHSIPYAYWNFGGSYAVEESVEVPSNHSPFFAPEIETTLKAGADAMALAVLTLMNV